MVQQTTHQTQEMKTCADDCTECRRVCEQTLAYCLEQGGDHAKPSHVQLLRDCIAMCEVCASACDRGSENCATICKSCAEICKACADDCASFSGDDQMQACAEACRKCAKSCEAVA